MPVFRCRVRGERFPGALAGEPGPVGFYTTRYVQAPSAEAAESAALTQLRAEPGFARVRPEEWTEAAQVFFERIEQVGGLAADASPAPGRGFTFFRMET